MSDDENLRYQDFPNAPKVKQSFDQHKNRTYESTQAEIDRLQTQREAPQQAPAPAPFGAVQIDVNEQKRREREAKIKELTRVMNTREIGYEQER